MVDQAVGVSLSPDDMVAGGLMDDVDVTWKGARFALWDYGGKVPTPVPALKLTLVGADGEEHEQYYSTGAAKDWSPSPDGKMLIPLSGASLRSTTNFAMLMQSIWNTQQFPRDRLSNDISVFEGIVAHMIQVAAPKRKGLAPKMVDGKEVEATVLVVDKIIKLPWEGDAQQAKAGKGKGKSAGKTAAVAASAETAEGAVDEIAAETEVVILEILAENPDGIQKKSLPVKIIQKRQAHPQKSNIISKAYDDVFLGDAARPWAFADGVLKMR